LPNGPRYLIGLTNLRGNLTPVFDVHSWLGVDSNVTKIKSLFVIDRGEEAAGFFIDGLPVAVDVDQASPAEQPKDFPNLVRGMSAEALSLDGKIWTSVKHRALFERIAREY
jgi:chemotaxis signal transduction protein